MANHPAIHELGKRFRAERALLESILDSSTALTGPLAEGMVILRHRTQQIRPLFLELEQLQAAGRLTTPLEEMLGSFIHLSVNRLLSSAQRAQEMVIYHFLARLYESRISRTSQADRSII